jgi:hypothetical protein
MSKLMPSSAPEALALWDSGQPVPAFQVESEGSAQDDIYAFAFELIRAQELEPAAGAALTERERNVGYSIALVAKQKGWAVMVQQHVGPQIPAITIQKRKPDGAA